MSQARPGLALRAIPAVTAAIFVIAVPASAQQQAESGEKSRDLIVTAGGGPQFLPRYPGADELTLSPMPLLSFRHVGEPLPFSAADQGASLGILGLLGNHGRVDFGPTLQAQGPRRDKDVGAPVGKVGFTIEAGAFFQAYATPWLRLRAEGRRGIGGHRAWVGDLSADLVARDDDRTVFSIGPRLRLGDGRYQRAYFGVTPAVATATGLAAYRPGSGVYAAGLSSSITHQFNDTWGLRGYVGYDRLVRDAADSPIVRAYGSRDQFSGGLGLTYSFHVHRGS